MTSSPQKGKVCVHMLTPTARDDKQTRACTHAQTDILMQKSTKTKTDEVSVVTSGS